MDRQILVVEDEQSLAKLVASYPERYGHRVRCVFDGEHAIAAAREQPPDLVVLDLTLPSLDGIPVELARTEFDLLAALSGCVGYRAGEG